MLKPGTEEWFATLPFISNPGNHGYLPCLNDRHTHPAVVMPERNKVFPLQLPSHCVHTNSDIMTCIELVLDIRACRKLATLLMATVTGLVNIYPHPLLGGVGRDKVAWVCLPVRPKHIPSVRARMLQQN